MGILRLLLRAVFSVRRRRRVAIRRETTARRERAPARGRADARRSIGIEIVDTVEIRGRAWVIDGDTIDIGGVRIRLFGIDAPEMDHPYGHSAKWTLVGLCKGRTVRAEIEGGLSYDRTVARCFLPDGRDLSAEMVRAGMAIDWPKFSGGLYARFEPPDIRKKLWRCDARQKGRMPPRLPD